MKKGFTLIELLAVIVVLAIIALIVMPVIGNIIESSRKASFRESVNNIMESSKNYIATYMLEHRSDDINYPIEFVCNGITCEGNGYALEINGDIPNGGKIYLYEDGRTYADYVTDSRYCAIGYKGEVRVSEECNDLDITAPEIISEDITIRSTTNSIIVEFPITIMKDEETGISRYEVKLYKGNTLVSSHEGIEVVFNNLESNQAYKVEVIGINGNDMATKINKNVNTLSIINPIISTTTNPSEDINGYVISDTKSITFDNTNIENAEYYIKSSRTGLLNNNTISECGTENRPSSCSSLVTTTMIANTWYKVSGNIEVTYNSDSNSEDTLIALTYDGTNYSGAGTSTIAKIKATHKVYLEAEGGSVSSEYIEVNKACSKLISLYNIKPLQMKEIINPIEEFDSLGIEMSINYNNRVNFLEDINSKYNIDELIDCINKTSKFVINELESLKNNQKIKWLT